MFLCPGSAVDVVPSVGLGDEHATFGIDRQAIEQRPKSIDNLDELVGRCIEDIKVSIRDLRIFDDVDDCPKRKDIIVVDDMLPGVEGRQIAVERTCASRDLRLIVRLERNHVELTVLDCDGAWILRGDRERLLHSPRGHTDDGDLIFRRERNIRLFVGGDCHADGFVEASGLGFRIDVLDRGDDLKVGRALGVGIDDADGV